MTEAELQRIHDVRHRVLHLHKQLLEVERIAYERVHGRIAPADFLRIVIENAAFAWLRPMTAAIVRIDEWLDEDAGARADEIATAWLAELAHLLAPEPAANEFHHRYVTLLQEQPDIVVAHGAVIRALTARGS